MKALLKSFLIALLCSVSAGTVFLLKPPAFETSLETLAGGESLVPPGAVRGAVSSRVQAVSSSKSFDAALDLAGKFVAAIDTNSVESLTFTLSGESLGAIAGFYSRAGGGFLCDGDRAAAENGTLNDVVTKGFFSSLRIFQFEIDPFGFKERFVKSLPRGFGKWTVRDEVLWAESDGLQHVLVSFALPASSAFDIKSLPETLGPILETCRRLNAGSKEAKITVSGVPVHTLETSSRCESQIAYLSIFSLLVIFLLALKVLKTPRNLILVALNLLSAASAGFLAVNCLFDTVHLVALVFGTTLIGLAVDYSFHTLLAAAGNADKVRRNLFKSFLTTVVSLLPLAFSDLPALVQTAVFLTAGLAASFLANYAILFRPDRFPAAGAVVAPARWMVAIERSKAAWWILPVMSLVALGGVFCSGFRTEPGDLHRPSDELAGAERRIAELSGIEPGAGMAVVRGATLEEILQTEERCFPGSVCLSKFVPSLEKRRRDFSVVIKDFAGKNASSLVRSLGLADYTFPPALPPVEIKPGDIPESIASRFLFKDGEVGLMTLVPSVSAEAASAIPAGEQAVRFYAPRTVLTRLIDAHSRRSVKLLLMSFALLAAMLAVFYRFRAVLIVLPSVLAVTSMFAFVTFVHGHVNFFHLLAAFMITGMALDYTIFLAADFRSALKSVVCSLLTSFAGFGALAFVSLPVVSSFGIAFAFALPASFLAAWAVFRPLSDGNERVAIPVGMEIAWVLYRVFGKGVFDFVARAVAVVVWLVDPVARKAATSPRRMINFALSLADKIAVLSDGKGQPEVRFDDSADARAFLDDVAAKKGAVVISSHLGNIEALAAYGECAVKFHVFMSLSQTGTFRAFKERHSHRTMIDVHPTEGFGMAELFLGSSIVDEGGVVLIAGDRGGGRMKEAAFLGGRRLFPEGAFRFARHLERNVYFIAAVREIGGSYRVFVRRLPDDDMFGVYVRELDRLVKIYPDQWYQWETKGGENG